MNKIFALTTIIIIFSITLCYAESGDTPPKSQINDGHLSGAADLEETGVRKEYIAEQKVKMLPSKHGDTVDSYMTNMARIPMAEDLGWQVYPREDGYEVERSILVNNSKKFSYKWKVSHSGEVRPMNKEAESLMK